MSCRPSILDAAAAAGVKISWHLEPYESGRGKGTADEIKKDIAYINAKYRHHPACLKDASGLAVFFVYDSYRTPAAEWATLFTKVGVWHQQPPFPLPRTCSKLTALVEGCCVPLRSSKGTGGLLCPS